jgi:hypothetical protein
MKATLSFNLPEESIEHLDALHGHEWKTIVMDLYRLVRNARKHGHNYNDANAAVDDVFFYILNSTMDRGLTLD